MEFSIRVYQPDDAAALADVMWCSVRTAALADYSPEQTAAWLPERPRAEDMHRWASDGRHVLVAADAESRVVGYIDLESDGHIDHLYCAPAAVGQGVASALYDAVEGAARTQGLSRLRVEASEAARRLFEKKGFTVDGRRDWERRGVPIHNYKMSKVLRTRGASRAQAGAYTATQSMSMETSAGVGAVSVPPSNWVCRSRDMG